MNYHPVPDYHMHTPRCNHAIGKIADYAAAAVKLGLHEIGMSDHSPMPNGFDKAWRMTNEELPSYLHEIRATQKAYQGKLCIRLGLEVDFYPGSEAAVAQMIQDHDWDYIMGSVHFIDDWGFDNEEYLDQWQHWSIEDAYCAYFERVQQSAECGLFDIIGHPDLIKKFGHRAPMGSKRVQDAEEAMLQAVKKHDLVLEISSAGLRKTIGEIYPHARMIARAATLGIPFAYGSDAHAPGEVAHAMDTCLAVLQQCGVHEIMQFQQRQRSSLPIRKKTS